MKKHLKQFLAVVTVLIMVLAAVPTFAEEVPAEMLMHRSTPKRGISLVHTIQQRQQ